MHYGDFSHWLGMCMFLSDNYVRNRMSRHAVNTAINSASAMAIVIGTAQCS